MKNPKALTVTVSLVFCLIFTASRLAAQDREFPNLTADFDNTTIKAVLDQLDASTAYDFFYKEEELTTRRFSFSFSETPLDVALDKILSGTTLSYLVYDNSSVVLVPKRIASEAFSISYYRAREAAITETEEEQQLEVGNLDELSVSGTAMVKGIVRDAESNEPVIGASVFWQDLDLGTTTDVDGRFELEVPAGVHYLKLSYVGFQELNTSVRILSDGDLRLKMEKGAIDLEEVTVSAQKADQSVEGVQIGVATLDVESIKKTPSFLGEADVVKSLLLNAGVSTIGEGATGFNVRGGDVDQNLILQDEGILLSSSHALGFYSYFNTDLLENVELYKANMPAQYGGRLSSVMDVKMKDGNYEEFKIKGGVGPVTSRISLEGPIAKDKVSFIGGFRASYADWVLNQVRNIEVQRSSAFFYDANMRISAKLGDKNTLILSGYASEDEFTFNEEFGFDYSTYLGQVILKSIFSESFYSNFSASYVQYESTRFDFGALTGSQLDNNVNYIKIKEQLTFSPTTLLKMDAGFSGILYTVEPGTVAPFGEESTIPPAQVEDEKGLEAAAFLNTEYSLSDALLVSAGLRLSYFQFLGPNTVYNYEDSENPLFNQVTGTTEFGSGESIASYFNLEPRLSLRYRLNGTSSVKAGYSRTVQYISQIFNSASPTPISQWQLSTNYIEPNTSHNMSVGFFKNLKDNNWETTAEVYYRILDNLFDYKDFAELTVNDHLETELLSGEGRSYGLELSIKKKTGVLNGALNYTLSRSERLVEGINDDDWYPSNFDKPHDLSLVFNYQPNRRNTLTINFVYGSGRPTTPPVGNYLANNGLVIPLYANRNQLRIPDYHRLDVAYTLGKGYKRDRKFQTSWTISLYNVYGRRNAFSVFFTQAAFQGAQANKLAILGSIFPSITFNFEAL